MATARGAIGEGADGVFGGDKEEVTVAAIRAGQDIERLDVAVN